MEPRSQTIGPMLDISIEKLVYGGDGLARTSQGVLLVPGVMPGERATVQVEPLRRGVRRGRLVELLAASQDRVAADCPYFARCGGCHYQHIRYERQLELKQEILRECLERTGKIRLEVPVRVLAAEPWHYRNRARLQVEKQTSVFQVGYFESFSQRLCAVESCPISSPAINEVIQKFSQGAGASCFPEGKTEVELFASETDQALLATVYSSLEAPPDFGDKLMSMIPTVQSVAWLKRPEGRRTTWGSGMISYRVGEFHYRVSHDSFFQTNRFLLAEMIQAVVGDLEGKTALDLYAGVGFFTIPLTRRFEKLVAVENHPSSARDLASNVGVVEMRARAHRMAVEKFLQAAASKWEMILVNPPRSGLSRSVIEPLCRLRPTRLVYISCDPTTLARDLAAITSSGFHIRSVHLVDQFPQTFHLETIVHLERVP
ncbi:MAG: 23S rRNA (uracil(1939)-C(5))-methyltransferase RlmD [Acidobacteria bacterium]|nr:23S rRNA (uracil(1939)-C(5))-methyltransferase RlmD [Acidobacteriota bacterium]